ncbi:hypothetical protein T492DRAFT_855635 [Pavlovales sp. CCMP2436]|nr:hypothetical protein T492DRAFT_855635 [Pavlovales sp. CCMP2436]
MDALASSGLEQDILLWPISLASAAVSKPMGVLHGHSSPVQRVLSVEELLNDPTHTQKHDMRGSVEVSALEVSAASARKTSAGEQQRTHDHTPSLAVHNAIFDVVVSADESSSLAVWKCLGRFDRAHGSSKITSLAFDSSGARVEFQLG